MYLPTNFRYPSSPGPQSAEYPKPSPVSPTLGGVLRPSPYPRPVVGSLTAGTCPSSLPTSCYSRPSVLPSIATLPGFSTARMAIDARGPSVCLPRPVAVNTTGGSWLQSPGQTQGQAQAHVRAHVQAHAQAQAQAQAHAHAQAQAAAAFNFSHLQQIFVNEKAIAASQYLGEGFPSVPNPFFDLAQMGHYPLGKKLFGCPQCRYITDRKNNLKRHVATMHQECDKALECCGVVFKNKASLRDHVLIFHSNGYMCRFCGRNFCRKALLKRHLTVHSGQKDYVCSLCDYATSHKSNLERHKKVHERNGSEGSDSDSVQTDTSLYSHSEFSGSQRDVIIRSDDDDDDDINLSDIDVDEDDDALIDVVDIDIAMPGTSGSASIDSAREKTKTSFTDHEAKNSHKTQHGSEGTSANVSEPSQTSPASNVTQWRPET